MITDIREIFIGWSLRYRFLEGFDRNIVKWCKKNIMKNVNGECPGYGEYAWSWELHKNYVYFTFGRESDMLLFILRWS